MSGHPLFSQIKFNDGTHMTYHYQPGSPTLPDGISEGDSATVTVVGYYEDDQVACQVVIWEGRTVQPSGTLFHITTKAKPVESGRRATANGYTACEPYQREGTWDIFRARPRKDRSMEYIYQLDSAKICLWVHASDGSTVGRFNVRAGIDIHTTVTEQLAGKSQCKHCTHEPPSREEWEMFRAYAREHWLLDIPLESIDLEKLSNKL